MLRFALSELLYQVLNKKVYQYLMHAGSMTFNPTNQEFVRIAKEHIEMNEYYLQQNILPQPARSFN